MKPGLAHSDMAGGTAAGASGAEAEAAEASGADPEEIGRSLYETAERYLLRTLRSVSG